MSTTGTDTNLLPALITIMLSNFKCLAAKQLNMSRARESRPRGSRKQQTKINFKQILKNYHRAQGFALLAPSLLERPVIIFCFRNVIQPQYTLCFLDSAFENWVHFDLLYRTLINAFAALKQAPPSLNVFFFIISAEHTPWKVIMRATQFCNFWGLLQRTSQQSASQTGRKIDRQKQQTDRYTLFQHGVS